MLWAKERAGVDLWSKQRETIESVRDHPLTAVKSAHETGKSFNASVVTCWWLDVHPPGSAFVVTTAPTGAQVEAILWREINKLHQRAGLPGRTNLTEWYMGKEMVAFGRKPSDYNPHAFQGLHARYFLCILDEACGVKPVMWNAASTLAANEHSRILAIGNPDDPQSEFAENCKPDSGWNVIRIAYWDTPNFTGEPVSRLVADSLIHPSWVEGRRKKWGPESALFISKCEGEFPTMGNPFAVVPYGKASQCRYVEIPGVGDVECGIDVGGGGDRTVCRLRVGRHAGPAREFVDADPMRTVGVIAQFLAEHSVRRAKIDVAGIGWGIYGRLKELSRRHFPQDPDTTHDAEVIPINFGSSAPPGFEKKFLNMRAWAWWEIGREFSRLGTWDLTEVDDDVIHELTTPLYEILSSQSKIKIERKEEIIKRLGFSPDHADALILAFIDLTWEVGVPAPLALAQDLTRNVGPTDQVMGSRHRFGGAMSTSLL